MGNRTNVSEDGVNKSYVPNNLNQYTTAHGIGASNGTSHQISSYDGTSYNYTGDTYLAKATAGNNSYTLFYDALGRLRATHLGDQWRHRREQLLPFRGGALDHGV